MSGSQPAAPARDRQAALAASLTRYRIMAWIVGVGLALVVFVGMPLQFGAGDDIIVKVVGTAHGYLYIVYLVAALDLARRARFTFPEMAAMVGAGLIPGLAFVIERKITRKVRAGDTTPWRFPWQKAAGSARP